ncbi:MAG: HAMP domain-containing sensor histidine kinase [Chloroflexota bacterium]
MQQLLQIYRIPRFDDDKKQRIARIFYWISYTLLIPLPMHFVVQLVGDNPPEVRTSNLVSGAIFLFIMTGLMAVVQRGHVRTGTGLLLAYLWLSLALLTYGGATDVRSPGYSWFLIFVIIAALLIGNRGTVLMLLASIALVSVVYVQQVYGLREIVLPSPLFGWALHAVSYVLGALFVGVAVREGRQALDRARTSEARWRSLVSNIPNFVIEMDTAGRVTYVNRSDGAAALHGNLLSDRVAAEDADPMMQIIHAAATGADAQTAEIQMTLSGEQAWYRLIVSPVYQQGEVNSLLALARDITHEREAQQKARELELANTRNQTLKDAIAELSHDLKTPLTTISTSLFLLQRELDPEKNNPRFNTLNNQVSNLTELINDLLTITRLDNVNEALFEPVNANQLVFDLVRDAQPLVQQHGIVLVVEADDSPMIYGIASELRRALRNLLENAIHYNVSGGRVWLRLQSSSETVVIEVEDTGIGIPPDMIKRIFERYVRTKRSEQVRGSGSGLGLAIVKKVVDLHDGQIEVSSVVDRGTVFRLRLPELTENVA